MRKYGFRVGDVFPHHKALPIQEEFLAPGNQLRKTGARWKEINVFDPAKFNSLNVYGKHFFKILQASGILPTVLFNAKIVDTKVDHRIRAALEFPLSFEYFMRALTAAIVRGIIPKSIHVYVTGPQEEDFVDASRAAHSAGTVALKSGTTAGVPRQQKKPIILARRDIQLSVNDQGVIRFNFPPPPEPDDVVHGMRASSNTSHWNHAAVTVNNSFSGDAVEEALNQLLYTEALTALEKETGRIDFYLRRITSDKKFLDRFRAATKIKPSGRTGPLVGPHREGSSRVSPSYGAYEAGGLTYMEYGNPKLFALQNADGTYRPEERKKQNWIEAFPAPGFKPVLGSEDGRFVVHMGLEFKSPITRGVKSQIWWYSKEEDIVKAAGSYATITGDIPTIARRLIDKQGRGKEGGKPVPFAFLEDDARYNSSSARLKAELATLMDTIKRAYVQGRDQHGQYLMRFASANPKVQPVVDFWNKYANKEIGSINKQEVREFWKAYAPEGKRGDKVAPGLNREDFVPVIKQMRQDLQSELGIQFRFPQMGPGMPQKRWSRKAQEKQSAKLGYERYKGEKGERWKLYVIQYIIAHGQTTVVNDIGGSFLIPTNVNSYDLKRSKVQGIVDRVEEDWLKDAAKAHPETRNILGNDRDWEFISGGTRQQFPYARLIKEAKVAQGQADDWNRKYGSAAINRTKVGYRIEGVEYEAYYMITAMPPSVATQRFKVTEKGKNYRRLMDGKTAASVRAAIRGRGLTPTKGQLSVPDRKSKQVTKERLRMYTEHGPMFVRPDSRQTEYSGITVYRNIRPGTFEIICGTARGKANLDGEISGPGIGHGFINTKTGEWKLRLSQPPNTRYSKAILANYYCGDGIPKPNPLAKAKIISPTDPSFGLPNLEKAHLVPEEFWTRLSRRFSPQIHTLLKTVTSDYVRLIQSAPSIDEPEERFKHLAAFEKDTNAENEDLTENLLRKVLNVSLRAALGKSSVGLETEAVIRYADGGLRTVPIIEHQPKIKMYTAVIAGGRGQQLVGYVKAPTADVAKLLFLYRLLRRSAKNPLLGKPANVKTTAGKYIIHEFNMQILHMWKMARFAVVEAAPVEGTRWIAPKRPPLPRSSIAASTRLGAHRYGIMVRH